MKILLLSLFCVLTFSQDIFAADRNCQQGFWRRGIPREGRITTPFMCVEFTPTINSLDPRFVNLYFHTSRAVDPELSTYMEKAAESLKLSIELAKNIFNYSGKIKLILDFNDHPRDISTGEKTYGQAYPFFAGFGEACPIMMFPKSEMLAPDVLGQIIAHELFHCVQAQKWGDQLKIVNDHNEGRWWAEGSAQWFSDLVYPNADYEYDNFWGHYRRETNIVNQPDFYTTVIFFQAAWESANHGALNYSEIFRKMPKTIGADQLTSLESVPLIQVYYHNFVRQYVSRTIKDAGNKNAPIGGVDLERVEINTSEVQGIRFPLRGFAMEGRKLILPAKSSYNFNFNATNDVRVSYKKRNETIWHDVLANFPNQITTKCSENEEVDLVFTSTKKDFEGEIVFNLKRQELEDCGCVVTSVPVDACLQGNWKMPTSSTAAFMQSHYPPGSTLKSTEGIWHLHFAEHSGKFTYEAIKYDVLVATVSPTNPTVPMDITLDGDWVFEASSEASNVCFKTRTLDAQFIATIHFSSGDVRSNLLETIIPSTEGAIELKCLNENQLLYRRSSGQTNSRGQRLYVDWIFNRE